MTPRSAFPVTPTSDHLALFSDVRFHELNVEPPLRMLRVDHHDGGRLVGSVVGVVDGGVFTSGYSAPWGGPDLVRQSESVPNVLALVDAWLDRLRDESVRTVRVRARPSFSSGCEAAVLFALLNRGFMVEACDLNYHVDLSVLSGIDAYVASLRSPARRALKHALQEPFVLDECTSADEWRVAYGLLERNRQEKGRSLRLSCDYVLRAHEAFPDRIRMFTLHYATAPCAAALVYRVAPQRELVVYWGDADHHLPRSPMNLLAYRMVERGLREGVLTLDLGISTQGGRPDQGLIQFKRSVLAAATPRFDLVRTLP